MEINGKYYEPETFILDLNKKNISEIPENINIFSKLHIAFFEDNNITNTNRSRTTGAIALNPTGNAQGDFYFMSLVTGKSSPVINGQRSR